MLNRTKICLEPQKIKANLDAIYVTSLSKGSMVSSEVDVISPKMLYLHYLCKAQI